MRLEGKVKHRVVAAPAKTVQFQCNSRSDQNAQRKRKPCFQVSFCFSAINNVKLEKMSMYVAAKFKNVTDSLKALDTILRQQQLNNDQKFAAFESGLIYIRETQHLQAHLAAVKDIYIACKQRLLSSVAVAHDDLLLVLQQHVFRMNLTKVAYVLQASEVDEYYSLPTVSCVRVNDTVLKITFGVPVKRTV